MFLENRARFTHITALLLAAVMLAGCEWLGFKSWDWNQKLTLQVNTPGGVVSGSSVVSVHREEVPSWMLGGGQGYKVRGEAVVIEVQPGRYLFALLSGAGGSDGYHAYLPVQLFPGPDGERYDDVMARLETTRATQAVPRDRLPMLVTFGDINLPQTVREVKPHDLAKHFGPGVSLASATLEITDEPVTQGVIEGVLGWIYTHQGRLKPTDKKYAKDVLPEEQLYVSSFVDWQTLAEKRKKLR